MPLLTVLQHHFTVVCLAWQQYGNNISLSSSDLDRVGCQNAYIDEERLQEVLYNVPWDMHPATLCV